MRKVVSICVGVAALAAVLSGQGLARSDSDMQALVGEIRSLRADLNRAAGASIRSQLLVGRLQLQEGRILTLSRQVDDVQKEIAGVAQGRIAFEAEMERFERLQETTSEEREHAALAVKQVKQKLAQQQHREQQLRAHESSLSALIAEEQARWTDFNSRLDELERTLSVSRDRD